MSTRGDLFIKDKNGSVNRYLIRHDAYSAEYFQKALKFAMTHLKEKSLVVSESSLIEQMGIFSPDFLELENDDIYGGLNITLNMADDSIEIKNSDADAYTSHSKDIFKFNGKIDDFLKLDLEKALLERKSTASSDRVKVVKFMPIEYNFPQGWASYLINDDCSGMEDDEIESCNAWLDSHKEDLGDGHWSINYEDGEDYIEPEFMKNHDAREVGVLAADCFTFTWNKKIELDKNIADAIESKSVEELQKSMFLINEAIDIEKTLKTSELLDMYENEKTFIEIVLDEKEKAAGIDADVAAMSDEQRKSAMDEIEGKSDRNIDLTQ